MAFSKPPLNLWAIALTAFLLAILLTARLTRSAFGFGPLPTAVSALLVLPAKATLLARPPVLSCTRTAGLALPPGSALMTRFAILTAACTLSVWVSSTLPISFPFFTLSLGLFFTLFLRMFFRHFLFLLYRWSHPTII
ncbi:MAG: hypothetical protein WBC04_00150 [Candidatus Acidiferrales bacterium]